MRRVGRNVCEERLRPFLGLADPVQSRVEEHVGAEAVRLDEPTVQANHGVEVAVVGRVRAAASVSLPDAASAVDKGVIETTTLRLVSVLVAQVPLAEDGRLVARIAQHLRQRDRVERHPLALEDRVSDPVAHRVPPRHHRRPRGRACRADQEPVEPQARVVQPVQIRGSEPWVPVASDLAITLVVRHHQEDVRTRPSQRRFGRGVVSDESCQSKKEQ